MASHHTRKSERTRQTIIEKTAAVFNKKGISGTSLSDLTRATGLTKGSIYGNFRDKNDVAQAVFKHNVEGLFAYLRKHIERQDSPFDRLLAIPEAYRRLYPQMIDFGGCPIANTATEADDTHPELRREAKAVIARMIRMTVELLEQAKQAGEVQHLVDSEKTADIILSLIEGGTILAKATGRKRYLMHALEQVEHLIYSIRGRIKNPGPKDAVSG